MKASPIIIGLIVFVFLLFKIFLGIQINFSHEDFTQIFLIGLEDAYSGIWSYWGPDVVWSSTRLAGALQGMLIGVPLRIFHHPYAPIVLSNIITMLGLVLMILYAFKRFPNLPKFFVLFLVLLLPFNMIQGAVLLNTSYLIFSGALLFIATCELFIYRDDMIFENTSLYYFALGFGLIFTYQLHLTYVMFLPFIVMLVYFEWKAKKEKWWKPILFLIIGALLSGITFFPTLIQYGHVMFNNTEGNLSFDPARFGSIFDLFARYFTFATFDITVHHDYYALASEKSKTAYYIYMALKVIAVIQLLVILFALFKTKKSLALKKVMLLFGLTLLMALFLFVISTKHLSARTYILLYPIPIWLSFYAYSYLTRYKQFRMVMNVCFVLLGTAFISLAALNYNEAYSFKSVETKMEKAIEDKNPAEFGERRKSIMDAYK